jgi:predicted HicB family RNase H-like nuclease
MAAEKARLDAGLVVRGAVDDVPAVAASALGMEPRRRAVGITFTVRLSEQQHRWLRAQSGAADVSIQAIIIEALRRMGMDA